GLKRAGTAPDASLAQELAAVLPEYMVPSTFVELDSLPISLSGKVDKRALPEPDAPDWQSEHTPPANFLETKTCHIWQTLLCRAPIGVTDNFFKAGGNSI